jgi:hypothetical protein
MLEVLTLDNKLDRNFPVIVTQEKQFFSSEKDPINGSKLVSIIK